MPIGKLDRVAVAVRDIDKARDFFGDLFGITFDPVIDDHGAGVRVVYSLAGIELIAPMPVDKPFAHALTGFLDEHGEGINVVAFAVDDFDAALEHFAARGVRPTAFVTAEPGREALFSPADTFGVPIVLNACPAVHPMTTAALNPGTTEALGARLEPAAGV